MLHQGERLLMSDEHIDHPVLQHLEAADGDAELLSGLGVFQRRGVQFGHGADCLGAERADGPVTASFQQGDALALAAEQLAAHIAEGDLRGTAAIDGKTLKLGGDTTAPSALRAWVPDGVTGLSFNGGDEGVSPSNGNQVNPNSNRLVTLTFTGADRWNVTGLRFSSTSNAFEFDNVNVVTAGVPEPASWALMLGGFGAIGFAMRSRRKAALSFS